MDEIEKITKKVLNNPHASMSISRMPKTTKQKFVKLAEDEFCNDYGMALKFLYDNFEKSAKFDYLLDEIDMLKDTLVMTQEEEKPKKKMLSGKELGGKENE